MQQRAGAGDDVGEGVGRRGAHQAHVDEAVHEAVVACPVDLDPGLRERVGVRLALVAQRVVLRGDDDRRGKPGEVAEQG